MAPTHQSSIKKLPSPKTLKTGTTMRSDGRTYTVIGTMGDTGRIARSRQIWGRKVGNRFVIVRP